MREAFKGRIKCRIIENKKNLLKFTFFNESFQ